MSGGGGEVAQVESSIKNIENRIRELEGQIARVQKILDDGDIFIHEYDKLQIERRSLERELHFQNEFLAGRKERLAELKAGRWRVEGEGLEEWLERRKKELLTHAERGPGVYASGGLDRSFVDLSMSGRQW